MIGPTIDQALPWTSDLPPDWRLVPLKHLITFRGGGTPSRDEPQFWNGSIPWVSPKDMKREVISSTEEMISEEGLSSSATSMVPEGSVLLVVRSGILKHTIPVAINAQPVALNQDMRALLPGKDAIQPEFLLRWVQGFNDTLLKAWSKQGATVESIEHEYLAGTLVPVPPLPAQTAIAAFLDRETAKIDALMDEQKRLIELLKEKRQAIISHAVTKGLDPHARMKPSGAEWLGDVPEHWDVAPLSRIADRVIVGIAEAAAHAYTEEGIPILRSTNIRPGQIRGDLLYLDPSYANERGSKLINAGDLVTVRTGHAGVTAVVPPELDQCQCFTMLVTTLVPGMSASYVCKWLNSEAAKFYFGREAWGSAQPNISVPILKAIVTPVPPKDEQEKIATFLDLRTGQIDALAEEAASAVKLLQERRSALISAAVTGKIDVQSFITQEVAA